MKKTHAVLALVLVAGVFLAACGQEEAPPAEEMVEEVVSEMLEEAAEEQAAEPEEEEPAEEPAAEEAEPAEEEAEAPTEEPEPPPFTITTDAFEAGDEIPESYGFFRDNVSPAFTWEGVPEGTVSLALVMEDIFFSDDPYGPAYHWIIFNIPADAGGLPEGIPAGNTLADGSMQAQNFAAEVVYAGPYPPPDEVHEYTFTLYALDATLDVPGGAPGEDVLAAMEGHILASIDITGWYLGFTP